MTGNAEKAWRKAMALGPFRRGGRSLPYWASYLKGRKGSWGQDKRGSWKVKAHREEGKKKVVRVLKATLGQSLGQEHCLFGRHWDTPSYRVQTKRDYQHLLRRQGRAIAS